LHNCDPVITKSVEVAGHSALLVATLFFVSVGTCKGIILVGVEKCVKGSVTGAEEIVTGVEEIVGAEEIVTGVEEIVTGVEEVVTAVQESVNSVDEFDA